MCWTRFLLNLVGLLIFAASSYAIENLGEIKGSTDGQEKVWYVLSDDDESNSSWSQVNSQLLEVSIWGSANAQNPLDIVGTLMLDFNIWLKQGIAEVADPEIQFLSNGFAGMYFAGEDQGARISVAEQRVENGKLHVAGTYEATAYFRNSAMSKELDRSKAVTLKGKFSVLLPTE